jgi:hypothetical protein
MRRFRDYLRFLVWNSGLGYIALWAITFWTLDYGPAVLGRWGGCAPDPNTVLFYWVCDSASPFSILAAVANSALTITIWAPVYVGAAIVRPEAAVLAAPIIGMHLIGLAAAILVTARLMLALFGFVRRVLRLQRGMPAATPTPDALILAQPETTLRQAGGAK